MESLETNELLKKLDQYQEELRMCRTELQTKHKNVEIMEELVLMKNDVNDRQHRTIQNNNKHRVYIYEFVSKN